MAYLDLFWYQMLPDYVKSVILFRDWIFFYLFLPHCGFYRVLLFFVGSSGFERFNLILDGFRLQFWYQKLPDYIKSIILFGDSMVLPTFTSLPY